jgi:hypothetical protein
MAYEDAAAPKATVRVNKHLEVAHFQQLEHLPAMPAKAQAVIVIIHFFAGEKLTGFLPSLSLKPT